MRNGTLREDVAPKVIRDLIYGGIEHAVWRSVFSDRDLEVGELAEQLSDAILGGILAVAQSQPNSISETVARLERAVDRLESQLDSQSS